jgi:hypothetical protein
LQGTTGNTRFNVWADLDGSNGLQTRYLRGEQPDRMGSVAEVTNGSGAVNDTITYDG